MPASAILIDSREPEWVQALTFGGVPTVVTLLEYGDLHVATTDGALLAIERKTPEDLLNSIRDERLWLQLAGLRQLTPWAYLLITGELLLTRDGNVSTDRGTTGWKWSAVQGALLKAQELGVMVTYAAGDTDYEAAILRLAARNRQEVTLSPVRSFRLLGPGEAVLASLPGIGPEKVGALLEYAGSAAWALQYLTAENGDKDRSVAGIGPITKANIRKALGLAMGTELAVVGSKENQNGEDNQYSP